MDRKAKVVIGAGLVTLTVASGVYRAEARPTGLAVDSRDARVAVPTVVEKPGIFREYFKTFVARIKGEPPKTIPSANPVQSAAQVAHQNAPASPASDSSTAYAVKQNTPQDASGKSVAVEASATENGRQPASVRKKSYPVQSAERNPAVQPGVESIQERGTASMKNPSMPNPGRHRENLAKGTADEANPKVQEQGYVERLKSAFRSLVASEKKVTEPVTKEMAKAAGKSSITKSSEVYSAVSGEQDDDFEAASASGSHAKDNGGEYSAESEPVARKVAASSGSVRESRGVAQSVRQRIGQFIGYFKSEKQKEADRIAEAKRRAGEKAIEDRRIAELEARSGEVVRRATSEIAAKTSAHLSAEAARLEEARRNAEREALAAARAEEEDRKSVQAVESAEMKRVRRLEAKVNSVKFEVETAQVMRKLGGTVEKFIRAALAAEELEDDDFESLQEKYVDICNESVKSTLQTVKAGLRMTAGDLHLLRVRTALYTLANELTIADREVGRFAWNDMQAVVAAGESHDMRATLAAYVAYSRVIVGDRDAQKKLEKFVKQIKGFDSVTAAVLQNRSRTPASQRRR